MSKTVRCVLSLLGLAMAGGAAIQAPANASSLDVAAGQAVQRTILDADTDAGTVPAQAGGWDRCPAGYFCLFDGYDGTGVMAFFKTGSPNLGAQGLDKAASAQWNRSPWNFCTYEGYNYTGRSSCNPPGSRYNFTYFGGNNFDSSVKRL